MSSVNGLGRAGVAAITFSAHGGGIAAVSRLVRRALTDEAQRPAESLVLSSGETNFETGVLERTLFGAKVALAQITRRCDWILYTHLSLATVQRIVPPPFRKPYAVFLHDIEAWTPLSPFRRRVLAGAFLRVANSAYTARRVREANPDCGVIETCPLALLDDRAPEAGVVPFAMGSRAIVIVGRMMANERYKGHDQLIEAMPHVLLAEPAAQLVCVGSGDDLPRLREKALALGVGGQVVFPGFVDDAARRAIYERAAVLAMPSRREGFGLVYLEAMAARVPCIGSVHDAASNVIVDGETGYLVSQDDRDALVSRLVSVLADDALRRRLGEAGYARYRREFTYEAFRQRITTLLRASLPHLRGPMSAKAQVRNA